MERRSGLVVEPDADLPAAPPDLHVAAGRSNEDGAAGHEVALCRFAHLDHAARVQALGQRAREAHRHVLDDEHRAGQRFRQPRDDGLQGRGAAGGGADHDHLGAGRVLGGKDLGPHLPYQRRRAQARPRDRGQHAHLGLQLPFEPQEVHVALDGRLVHEVHRAQLQAAEGDLGPLLRLRGEEEDGGWTVRHDAPQGLEPVHARHLDVEGDHVRPQVEGLFPAFLAVHGHAHHLDVGRGAEHAGEGLAHERGIVDDEHADHGAPAAVAWAASVPSLR
jgi:hypothetical protein